MAKVKELTKNKVSDNGTIEKPTPEQELESIKLQYQNSLVEKQKQHDIGQRCLGAIEILERKIENGNWSEKASKPTE